MALEVAGIVAGPVIEVVKWVAKPIVRQFNYLCCFTCNINSLKDEAKKLTEVTEELEEKVERERNNVQEPVRAVQSWLDDSKKINDEINGILNEATNVGTGCLKLGARFSLSKRAKKTTDRTKELRGEKPEAEFKRGPIAAIQGVQLEKPFECESRKKIEEDIMTTLRDGDVNMIGICGMGGLGKTTMAKKIMNRVLEEHVFEEVVIATVSQNVDISKIQDEIGGQLGLEKLKEERSQSARVQMLHARLTDITKRTLLVLNPIAKEVAKECGGLPIALAVVGRVLKQQRNAANWKNALRELKQGVPDTVRFDKKVYNPLKLSYNGLDSKLAQSLFLLCCLFIPKSNNSFLNKVPKLQGF